MLLNRSAGTAESFLKEDRLWAATCLVVIGHVFVRHEAKIDLCQHIEGSSGHRWLQDDNDPFVLTRRQLENNRWLKCLVRWILNTPAIKFSLRVHRLSLIIWRKRQILGAVRSQKLLYSLSELFRTLIDVKSEGLLICSLVVNVKFVSKALTRNILSKRDNFLLDCHYVSDIDLPFLTCFSRL